MKTILIAILAILSVVLVGVSAYQRQNQPELNLALPEVTPVSINQLPKTFSCASKADCVLAYIGTSACGPCGSADASDQCVSPAEAERLKQERAKKHGSVYCDMCPTPSQVFACACQNGSCTKVAVNCIAEGEHDDPASYNVCCNGLKKVSTCIPSGEGCGKDLALVCVNCGNGLCGKGENSYNCPQDCKSVTTFDEAVGWKVYRNAEEGIELKYPANFLIKENKVNIGDVGVSRNIFGLGIYDGEISEFEDRVFYFTDSIWTVEGEGRTDVDPNFFKKVIVDGIEGYTLLIESMKDGSSLYVTTIKKNGKIYEFWGNGLTFDRMLSTFQFIK